MKTLLNTRVIKKSKKDRYFRVVYKTIKFKGSVSIKFDCYPSLYRLIEKIRKADNDISESEVIFISSISEFKNRADSLNYLNK